MRVFASPDRVGDDGAQRADAADAAIAAVRAVADHAAAGAPWQIIRLAIKMAASDDELRVAATPYGIAVTIALHELSFLAAWVRTDIRRGQFDNVGDQLKILHDGVRGLRTELDLRNDSAWGRQLTTIRAEISNALQVGNRERVRPGPPHPAPALRQGRRRRAKIDNAEVEEIAALIDFVAVCRTYASELAINEVTLRTYSDLQHYVEQSTEAWCSRCVGATPQARAYRQMQAKAAIRFCEILFGQDYASLMKPGGRKCRDRRAQDRPRPADVHFQTVNPAGFAVGIVDCRACRGWCKAAHRRRQKWRRFAREPLDDAVVCVRADDGRGDLCRALAVESRRVRGGRRQRGGRLQGSACRDRARCRRRPDRRAGGRGGACRNRPSSAGGHGRPARSCRRGRISVCAALPRSWRW